MTRTGRAALSVLMLVALWTTRGEAQPVLLRYPEIRVARPTAQRSSARYTCLAAVSEIRVRAEVQCTGTGGRPLTRAVLVRVSDGASLVTAPVAGRAFTAPIADPPAAAVDALLDGDLRIRLLSAAGLEAQRTFGVPAGGVRRSHFRLARVAGLRGGQVQRLGHGEYGEDDGFWVASTQNPPAVVVDGPVSPLFPQTCRATRSGSTLFDCTDGIENDIVFFFDPVTRQVANGVHQSGAFLDVIGRDGQIFGAEADPCRPDADTLCLRGNRFEAEINWTRSNGQTGRGRAVPVTGEAGLFYFFNQDNFEMLLKVLDGCSVNNRFWVFAAATTNVEFTLTVTDTQEGATQTYSNPPGTPAPPIMDTSAFATCP